nr:uncharacterized protein LOC123760893 [Procambarus clarkii]
MRVAARLRAALAAVCGLSMVMMCGYWRLLVGLPTPPPHSQPHHGRLEHRPHYTHTHGNHYLVQESSVQMLGKYNINHGNYINIQKQLSSPHRQNTHDISSSVHSQNDSTHSQEDSIHSQDDSTHSLEDSTHSRDNSTHSRDNSTHSRDNSTHSRDNSTHSRDDSTHSRDDSTHSRDDSTHSRDDSTHNYIKVNNDPRKMNKTDKNVKEADGSPMASAPGSEVVRRGQTQSRRDKNESDQDQTESGASDPRHERRESHHHQTESLLKENANLDKENSQQSYKIGKLHYESNPKSYKSSKNANHSNVYYRNSDQEGAAGRTDYNFSQIGKYYVERDVAHDERGHERSQDDERGQERSQDDERGQERSQDDERGQKWSQDDERGQERSQDDERGQERWPRVILLIASWRSGSTFLGELLATAVQDTFYSYEPLHQWKIKVLRANDSSTHAAITLLSDLFHCRLERHQDQVAYMAQQHWYLRWNTRLASRCRYPHQDHQQQPPTGQQESQPLLSHRQDEERSSCSNVTLVSKVCRASSLHVAKVVRLGLEWVLPLLQEETLDLQVVYLVRDPRAVLRSRTRVSWCRSRECRDPASYCSSLHHDLLLLPRLRHLFPHSFKMVLYESLLEDIDTSVRELFAFLHLPVPEKRLLMLSVSSQGSALTGSDHGRLTSAHESESHAGGTYGTTRNLKYQARMWRFKTPFREMQSYQTPCRHALRLLGLRLFTSASMYGIHRLPILLPRPHAHHHT